MKDCYHGQGSPDSRKGAKRPLVDTAHWAPPRKRLGHWDSEEDAALCSGVAVYGESRWLAISDLVPNRTSKQCRERYMSHFRRGLDRSSFSMAEDELLMAAVKVCGTKWSAIAREVFDGDRADFQLKNRYYVLSNGKSKCCKKRNLLTPPEPEARKKGRFSEALAEDLVDIEPLELDSLLRDLAAPCTSPATVTAPCVHLAHIKKDHNLLPLPAKTSRSWSTVLFGSPTGTAINFDSINRALRSKIVDARGDAWDGLPRKWTQTDLLAPLGLEL